MLLCTNDDKLLVYGFYSRYNLGKIINSGYGDVSGLAEIEELSEKRIKGICLYTINWCVEKFGLIPINKLYLHIE